MIGKVRIIKMLPAYIMIIALLLMNIVNAAHADCAEDVLCDSTQVVASADIQGEQDSDQKNAVCDCCATSHHHHSHNFLVNGNANHSVSNDQIYHKWNGENYFSQPNSIPFQPPKA